jgi:endonuclease/exonuclease/phosphatase (EEP) superfamily protein YafD
MNHAKLNMNPPHGQRQRRTSGLSLAFTLLLAITTGPDASALQDDTCAAGLGLMPAIEGEALQDELDVLSWNIQKASNEGWAEDLAAIAGGVQLAFIQEASLQAQIPRAIPTPLIQAFAAGYTTSDQSTGVMTLSASNPSLHCNLTAWEPLLGTPKATSVTEYPLKDREERLLAINLHAVNFTLGLENFQQQFSALGELLKRHRGPVILAGDLNTWSDRRQALVDRFMQRHGLGAVTFEPDLRTTAFGRALDHIYVKGLQATFAQVIPVSSSDHNALRVRLAVQ